MLLYVVANTYELLTVTVEAAETESRRPIYGVYAARRSLGARNQIPVARHCLLNSGFAMFTERNRLVSSADSISARHRFKTYGGGAVKGDRRELHRRACS